MFSISTVIVTIVAASACLSLFIAPGRPIVPNATAVTFVIQGLLFLLVSPRLWKVRACIIEGVRASFVRQTGRIQPRMVFILTGLLLSSLAVGSYIWSELPMLSLERAIVTFTPLWLVGLLLFLDPKPLNTLRRIVFSLMFFGVFLAIIGIAIYFVGSGHAKLELGALEVGQLFGKDHGVARISSLTIHPNTLAIWLLFSLMSTYYLVYADIWPVKAGAILGFIQVVGLAMTASRAGIAATVIAVGLFAVLSSEGWKRAAWIVGLLVALFAIPLAAVMLRSDVSALHGSSRFSLDLLGRGHQWAVGWQAFREHWLLGVGFGVSFETVFRPAGIHVNAHNVYISMLSELGIGGFVLLLTLWISVLVQSWRLRGSEHTETRLYGNLVFSIFSALLLHQFFESTLFEHRPITLLLAVLAIGSFVIGPNASSRHLSGAANQKSVSCA